MERQRKQEEYEQQYQQQLRQQPLQQAQSIQPHTQKHMAQMSQTHMYATQTHMYAGQGMYASLEVARAWQSYADKASGRMYYHNTITKVTTWDRPQCFDAVNNASPPTALRVPQQQASVLKSPLFVTLTLCSIRTRRLMFENLCL